MANIKLDVMEIPNVQSGIWKIEEFEVTEEQVKIAKTRPFLNQAKSRRHHMTKAGKYKRLMRNGRTIMTNAPLEKWDCRAFIKTAKGTVLINGLGLGMVLAEVLNNNNIQSITVIENSEDVIKLVGPYFAKDSRVQIIHADAFTWKPPKNVHYDVVWHDIWGKLPFSVLLEMDKLHEKYKDQTDWQESWGREYIKL